MFPDRELQRTSRELQVHRSSSDDIDVFYQLPPDDDAGSFLLASHFYYFMFDPTSKFKFGTIQPPHMATGEACCTCAQIIGLATTSDSTLTEKPNTAGRRVECCGRFICQACVEANSRYNTYCPFCQTSSLPSVLPSGLRDPPSYSPPYEASTPALLAPPAQHEVEPPAYSERDNGAGCSIDRINVKKEALDVLHFLSPSDTLASLSLTYGVPLDVLRRTNSLYSDHLLQARRTILISGEYYKGGVSHSPRPVEGEEEEARKSQIRRWMVACKVADYDVAQLYLSQAGFDLTAAIDRYWDDERWEAEHPLAGKARYSKKPWRLGLSPAR